MARYFFDTNDGDLLAEDEDGIELRDDEAARNVAQAALPDMARDCLPNGEHRDFTVRVRNAAGATIYSASLALIGQWLPQHKPIPWLQPDRRRRLEIADSCESPPQAGIRPLLAGLETSAGLVVLENAIERIPYRAGASLQH